MFDKETRWFIRCDTCPDDGGLAPFSLSRADKNRLPGDARAAGWDVRDDLHRCPRCVREGRTEMAS